MNWKIELKPKAVKQYKKLDKITQKRINKALVDLESMENPFQSSKISMLTGKYSGSCRIRVGDWRIFIKPKISSHMLSVYAILPRGNAYR